MARIKILDYKGKVVGSWKTPKTKKQFVWSIVKLARFYYRCKESGLLTKKIVSVLQDFVNLEMVKRHLAAAIVSYPEILTAIQEIKSLKNYNFDERLVKIRRHERAICSFCKTRLRYPAYVVFQKGDKIIKISAPIGINCLNQTVGNLQNLIKTIDVSHDFEEISSPKNKSISKKFYNVAQLTIEF